MAYYTTTTASVLDLAGDGAGRLRLDADDRIVAVDDAWTELLGRRGAAAMTAAPPGSRLRDALASEAAAALYAAMLQRARRRFIVSLDVRAAERDRQRKLELRILSQPEGQVDLILRLLLERATAPVPLFDPDVERSADEVRVCSFCDNVLGFRWTDAETALRQLRYPLDGPQPRIRPAVCESCERRIDAACALRIA